MPAFITPAQAAALIKNNSSVGISGFGGWLGADLIFSEMRGSFMTTGSPAGLSVYGGILPGDLTENDCGMNFLAQPGMISRVTAAHVGMPPKFGRCISENAFPAFALPLGLVSNLLSAAAGKKPGVLTTVGLGTFVDPRVEGGALNEAARQSGEKVCRLTEINGEEFLFYPAFHLDACIIRVSLADKKGDLSAKRDPMTAEQLEMAMAVKAQGGLVIAQADNLVDELMPKEILIHSSIVDYIVVDEEHRCAPGYACPVYRPEMCGQTRTEAKTTGASELNVRKICGRRGAFELHAGDIVNLGIGIPDTVAAVAAEEGVSSELLLSVESGPLGGVPVGGVAFGASENPDVIYRIADNFNFYDGGGLNIAFLGAGEIDEQGNVNVSKFGVKTTGPGGFINIVQNTPVVCFMCTFTAGGLKAGAADGKLRVLREGREKKFRKAVQQITFSGEFAKKSGQKILYITERAVFELKNEGLVLTEIAPGVDLERDVLAQMDFAPHISPELKLMDKRIFEKGLMHIHL